MIEPEPSRGLPIALCVALAACAGSGAEQADASSLAQLNTDASHSGGDGGSSGAGGNGTGGGDAGRDAAASAGPDGGKDSARPLPDAATADAGVLPSDPGCAYGRFEVVEACVPTTVASPGAIEVTMRGRCDCGGTFAGCGLAQSYEEPQRDIVNLFPRCARCEGADAGCAAASEHEASCSIEGLPAGRYEIRLDNLIAGRSVVGDQGTADAPCFDPRATEGASCGDAPLPFTEHCGHSQVLAGARAYYELAVPCGACQLSSIPCEVEVAGDRIDLDVQGRTCLCDTCGECAPGCYGTVSGCLTPPLPEGRYQVFANGSELQTLEVGDLEPQTSCP